MPPDRTPGPFRFQGRRALLIYSQVGDFFTTIAFVDVVIERLRPLGNEDYQYKWAVEPHYNDGDEIDLNEDGVETTCDLHFAVDLGKMCTERGQVFDVGGHHPSLQPKGGKTMWRTALVRLERNGIFGGNTDEASEDDDGGDDEISNVFRQALEKDTYDEYSQTIAEGDPESFCKSWLSINACGRDRYKPEPEVWSSPFESTSFINVPPALSSYADYVRSDEEVHRPRALVVISPTRFGKTEWARSITPDHAYMATEWLSDEIEDDKRLLIFDDVPMSELLPRMRWKPFFGMQRRFGITGKYRGGRRVVRGWKGFIFLCNEDPREEDGVKDSIKKYITENADIITLTEKLYE